MASSTTQAVRVREREAEEGQKPSTERPADRQPGTKGKPFVVKIMTIIPN